MEMANQMLAEIKAAAKRKTLETKNRSSRISKDKMEMAQDGPLPALPQQQPSSVDEELSSRLSSSVSLAPQTPQKSPVVVPQTPPAMYNHNAPLAQQHHSQHSPQPQPPQQPYYSPSQSPMSMPQPPRTYPQQPMPPQQQQQRPPIPPAHVQPHHPQQQQQQQQPPYGYQGSPVNVDPRYQQHQQQQQQQQQMYYQQQQQQQQQNRPSMPYSPYQNQPPSMMGRPQPNPSYSPYQQQPPQMQQQHPSYGGMIPPPKQQQQLPPQQQHLQKQPSMMQQKRKVQLDNFSFLAVLGKGNFGKVMLAEEKFDKKLYAIKMLKKRFIIDNDEIER
jgi:classical protein kinase C